MMMFFFWGQMLSFIFSTSKNQLIKFAGTEEDNDLLSNLN